MHTEILVVGAGVSGLSCATRLVEAGKQVVVLEKSRGVGGRCATRRIGASIVDHGLAFYHGDDEELRATLERAAEGEILHGWPRSVRGKGAPCQPRAFRRGEWRLAFVNGATAFPKLLGTGLDVRLQTHVATVEATADRWRVADDVGRVVTARDLVLAVPARQALDLLDSMDDRSREFRTLRMLLGEIGFVSALTVIALYPAASPVPEWEMWYPENSVILQLISHDSSKRNRPERTALVMQALPAWSRGQWDAAEVEWRTAMLEEAGRLAGAWAARPETVQTHRWRFARVGSGGGLTGPVMIESRKGRRLAVAGEGFHPAGGVQAAWNSGRALAQRILEDR